MDSASLSTLRDAVHGQIRIVDPDFFHADHALIELLESPQVRRLQRIKQLPFSSSEFLAADHTRYAHALGTAHVTVTLLRRLKDVGFFGKKALTDLRTLPNAGRGKIDDCLRTIGEHMVFAGLLQDLGELPFKTATDPYFLPHFSLVDSLSDDFGSQASKLSGKDIFTLHAIRGALEASPKASARLSFQLLAYLISGLKSTSVQDNDTLEALRQLLDGPVDADRLDYVHRDTHHTLGAGFGSSAAHVVKSLIDVTKEGPIFDSPGPVSNFTMLRAILRFQVYSSPVARFHYTLLAHVLSKISTHGSSAMADLFGAPGGALSYETFSALDDGSLMTRLRDGRERLGGLILDPSSFRAVDILAARGHTYQHYWLNKPSELEVARDAISIPSDVFVDTYWDEERHRLYRPNSITVLSPAYSLSGTPVPLESTGGHVSEFLATLWDSTPVQGHVLFFVPENRSEWFLRNAGSEETRSRLYRGALMRDAEVRMSVADDTRSREGFSGPAIFVSFSWKDIHLARVVLRLLFEKRRRYFAYVEDFHGLGGDTRENGAAYARQADVGLILLSSAYLEASADPTSNIYAELVALGHSLSIERISLLAAEEGEQFMLDAERFPWRLIGRTAIPYLGPALAASNPHVLERAIDAMLTQADRVGPK